MNPQIANLILELQQKVDDLTRQNRQQDVNIDEQDNNEDAPVGAENGEGDDKPTKRPRRKKKKAKAN